MAWTYFKTHRFTPARCSGGDYTTTSGGLASVLAEPIDGLQEIGDALID